MNIRMYENDIKEICWEAVREVVEPDVMPEHYFKVVRVGNCLKFICDLLDLQSLHDLADDIYENISDPMLHVGVEFNPQTNDYEIHMKGAGDVSSSVDIVAGPYDVPERNLEPPAADNSIQPVDEFTSVMELNLDIEVVVEEGYYPDIKDVDAFEAQADLILYDDNTGFEYQVKDVNGVLDDLVSLLEGYDVPEAPGKYRMTGTFNLAYNMDGLGVENSYDYYGEEEGVGQQTEYYSDDLDVTFNKKASSIENLEFILIAEASTHVTGATVLYNNDAKSINKAGSWNYDTFQTAGYKGREFALYYVNIDTSEEADDLEMFSQFEAQISMIAPYDDASYMSARLANGVITYRVNNKSVGTDYYLTASDMGVENYEWLSVICDIAIEHIAEYNAGVNSKMIHN